MDGPCRHFSLALNDSCDEDELEDMYGDFGTGGSPVVKPPVVPKDGKDLQAFVESPRKLSKPDSLVLGTVEKSGVHGTSRSSSAATALPVSLFPPVIGVRANQQTFGARYRGFWGFGFVFVFGFVCVFSLGLVVGRLFDGSNRIYFYSGFIDCFFVCLPHPSHPSPREVWARGEGKREREGGAEERGRRGGEGGERRERKGTTPSPPHLGLPSPPTPIVYPPTRN